MPLKVSAQSRVVLGCAYILVTVHAHALDLVDNLRVVVSLLGARLCDLAAHILEEVLCKALLLCHTCNRLISS